MTERVRVGVIGVGNMGSNHARVFAMLRSAELVAVADPDPGARDEVAALTGARACADHRELLDLVDAVSVAVPTSLHLPVALDCLRAGRHVLVEKPLALTVADGTALLDAARARGLVLQVGHVERFNPAVRALDKILAGERLRVLTARRLSPPTPRVRDIDVVLDLLIHDLDIVTHLARSAVSDVSAMGATGPDGSLELVLAHLRFASGTLADLVASKVTQQRVRELELSGEQMFVTVNYRTRDVTIFRDATVSPLREAGVATYRQEGIIQKPLIPTTEPLYLELKHFLDCVAGRSPVMRPEEALASLALAVRVRDAALANLSA